MTGNPWALPGGRTSHVVYVGSASKTLAPAVRLGWMVLRTGWWTGDRGQVYGDVQTESLGQLTLADLIATHGYAGTCAPAGLRYRRRRDASGPPSRGGRIGSGGILGGLQTLVRLDFRASTRRRSSRGRRRGARAERLAECFHSRARTAGLVSASGTPAAPLPPRPADPPRALHDTREASTSR